MNKRNRDRLLAFARFLDQRAANLREFVKSRTPKRKPKPGNWTEP